MNMKDHILTALQEEFEEWEDLLTRMSEEQLTTPQLPSTWSAKDIVAHVYSWQRVSIARMEAAVANREPQFPKTPPEFDLDTENNVEGINAWFYETYRNDSWSTIHQNWSDGFHRLMELGWSMSERDLLDSSKYIWLKEQPLVLVLVSSYGHHQEHLDKLHAWLHEHGNTKVAG
jgi:hypothetical protein